MMDLPRAHGGPVLSATFRAAPGDFRVEELRAFEASGAGEHLLLTIEKRGMNTAFAAKRIAQWAGIPEMGIGYAGLKDRHAVTRQRFSVHLPKKLAPDTALLESDELRVLDAHWHHRKLPRGALAGNRFELVLRDVSGDADAIGRRLQAIAERGIPNYFGEQRFGREAGNVEAALRMFRGQRVRREQRSILLSAARSLLFNRVLARRVDDGSWRTGLAGDVWRLAAGQSIFGPDAPGPELARRVDLAEIHPTGPLWGRGELRTADAARLLETDVLAAHGEVCLGLEAAGLRQERRALRLMVKGLSWSWPAEGELELRFELEPGGYATGVLAELGDVRDASARGVAPAD